MSYMESFMLVFIKHKFQNMAAKVKNIIILTMTSSTVAAFRSDNLKFEIKSLIYIMMYRTLKILAVPVNGKRNTVMFYLYCFIFAKYLLYKEL